MNSARKPRRSRPAIRAATPAVGQAGRERGEAPGPHQGQIGDRGRRQGRGGAMGPMTSTRELPRAAYSSSAPGAA